MLASDGSPVGWWTEWQYHQFVARGRAELEAREQAKRLRRLRRRIERLDEQLCLAASAAEVRRYHRGSPWESRSVGEVEHSAPVGRVLNVR